MTGLQGLLKMYVGTCFLQPQQVGCFQEKIFFQRLRILVLENPVFLWNSGNDQIADWAYMDILGPVNTMPIGNELTIGYRQTVVGNQILTWESAKKSNLGLDLAFLRNRLTATADYFVNTTENILLRLPIPDVFGGPDYPYQNAGAVENRGWELQLGWKDDIKEFGYGLDFNIADVENKVIDLGGTEPTIGDRVRMEGEPLDALRLGRRSNCAGI